MTKVSPGRVVETYLYEVKAHGKRGAFRRTGDVHGISDQTVIRYVNKALSPDPVQVLSDDIAYTPCPGERPVAPRMPQKSHRPRSVCLTNHSKLRIRRRDKLMSNARSDVAQSGSLSQIENVSHHIPTLPIVSPGDLQAAPRVYWSPEYEARLRSVNRFATPAPVHVQDLRYTEPFNLRLWGFVALTVFFCIVLFATTHYHVVQPLSGPFAPSVSYARR